MHVWIVSPHSRVPVAAFWVQVRCCYLFVGFLFLWRWLSDVWNKIKVMLCSLISMELCITSMHWKDKPWQKRTTNKFSADSMMQFGAKDQTSKNWQLHYDNAPKYSSHLIQTFLARDGIPVVHQPSYSPDMAPCDFWLFPKLKTTLKGSRCESREEICRMRWRRWTPFQKKPSRSVFNSGRIGGLSVWRCKESTLKGIKVPIPSYK